MRTIPVIDGRWVLACAIAETIGMTASASAARVGDTVAGAGGTSRSWLALGVVVAGGLVEGSALGLLQARVLAGRWRALARKRFVLFTVAVAGIGWAAASAPSALGGDDGATAPPLVLILLGALGIGVVMGPVLGAAQSVALRGAVAHPWRWVAANTAAWPPVMVVIFLGASTAGAGWPTWVVAGYGAVTGALAGTALGLLSGLWLGSLDGQPIVNRAVLAMLAGRRFGIHRKLVGLAVRGRRTGRVVRFPVQYAAVGDDLVVVPGHPDRKSWWRNLQDRDVPVEVLHDGRWLQARAELMTPGDRSYERAMAAYLQSWPHSEPGPWEPVVLLHGVRSGIPATSGRLESVR